MTPASTDHPARSAWPFWALELTPECDNAAIEKAAREAMAKLTLGAAGAGQYRAPDGLFERDENLIREAKAILQDPQRRLECEFWYIHPDEVGAQASPDENRSAADWLRTLGVWPWAE